MRVMAAVLLVAAAWCSSFPSAAALTAVTEWESGYATYVVFTSLSIVVA